MVAKAMVPKLRFKEDDAIREREWSRGSIGNLFNVVSGGTPSRANQEFFQNGKHAWVRTTDLNNGFITTTSECLTDIALRETNIKILPEGAVVVAMYGGFNQIGRTGLLISPSAINQALSAILPNLDTFAPYFLLSYLNYKVDAWKEFAASSRKDPNITKEDVKSFELIFPDIKEQTKIANFLTAVDSKISQLTKKHELLTLYKKGVMQKIFNQELRFKDDNGREFSGWEEKPFGDVYDFFQTNSFSRDLLSYEAGIIKNIHYGDIHTKFKSNFSVADELVPFIKPEIDISRIPKECYCIEGDLIIADASEDYADVGKAIEIIKLGHTKLVSGLHTYIARNLSNTMALGFGGYLMQAEKVRLQIKTLASGISVLGISKGNLAKVTIPVPSKDEQTKIANFLTAIDDKITNVKSQLEAAKEYKQGLLQQIFV